MAEASELLQLSNKRCVFVNCKRLLQFFGLLALVSLLSVVISCAFSFQCCAHRLHIITKSVTEVDVVGNVIEKCRKIAGFFNHWDVCRNALKQEIEANGMPVLISCQVKFFAQAVLITNCLMILRSANNCVQKDLLVVSSKI